jgi:hypothetical protein
MSELPDPTVSDDRELMATLLPEARRSYVRVWQQLADARVPVATRRQCRAAATALAADHALVATTIRERQRSSSGEAALNLKHLADELERHSKALTRVASASPHTLITNQELRPESLGCSKRYRDPSRRTNSAQRRT